MPEEKTGVTNQNSTAGAPAAGGTDNTAAQPRGASNPGGGSPATPEQVDYDRFQQVVRARNQARSAQEQANALLAQALTRPSAPGGDEVPPSVAATKQPFMQNVEDQAQGEAAWEAVKGVSENVTAAQIEAAKNQMRHESAAIASQATTQAITEMQTVQNVENTIQRRIASGQLDADTAQSLRTRMEAEIQAQPQWGQGANRAILLNELYGRMLDEGTVNPGTYEPPVTASPYGFTGGGGVGGAAKSEEEHGTDNDAELVQIQSNHPSKFGAYTLEEMRNIFPADQRDNGHIIKTEHGAIEDRASSDRYVHTRPRAGAKFWQRQREVMAEQE